MMPLLLLTELLGSPEIDKGKQVLLMMYLQDRQTSGKQLRVTKTHLHPTFI